MGAYDRPTDERSGVGGHALEDLLHGRDLSVDPTQVGVGAAVGVGVLIEEVAALDCERACIGDPQATGGAAILQLLAVAMGCLDLGVELIELGLELIQAFGLAHVRCLPAG